MLFVGLFLFIAVACVIAIIAIIARKFPSLSLIDTESLPRERDAKKKQAIIEERVVRMTREWGEDLVASFAPAVSFLRKAFRNQHRRVLALERRLERATLTDQQVAEKMEKLRGQAAEQREKGNLEEAEHRYIDIISWDMGDVEAYGDLGEVYAAMKEDEQAKETFLHLLRLRLRRACGNSPVAQSPLSGGIKGAVERSGTCDAVPAERAEIAKTYANFAVACRQLGQLAVASDAFLNAVAFEPANPKYLDLLLETCILGGQKVRAMDAYARLKEVNPDNQKLPTFLERIQALPDDKEEAYRRAG